MGTSYELVKDGMELLKSHMANKEEALKMIIIDNYCMWTKKLKGTFGQNEVMLDHFHML